jgi:hypothetical protein
MTPAFPEQTTTNGSTYCAANTAATSTDQTVLTIITGVARTARAVAPAYRPVSSEKAPVPATACAWLVDRSAPHQRFSGLPAVYRELPVETPEAAVASPKLRPTSALPQRWKAHTLASGRGLA